MAAPGARPQRCCAGIRQQAPPRGAGVKKTRFMQDRVAQSAHQWCRGGDFSMAGVWRCNHHDHASHWGQSHRANPQAVPTPSDPLAAQPGEGICDSGWFSPFGPWPRRRKRERALRGLISELNVMPFPFILGGDWNLSPGAVVHSSFRGEMQAVAIATGV
eukprot:8404082-Pyramimonas_sp.AAC.1